MKEASLVTREYRTIDYVSGPLVFVENVKGASFGEMVKITAPQWRGADRAGAGHLGRARGHPGLRGDAGDRHGSDHGPVHGGAGPDQCLARHAGPGLHRRGKGPGRPPGHHPRGGAGHRGHADQPVGPRQAGRLHPDRYVRHRRARHAGPRPEAADLLRRGPPGKQARRPDRPAGKGAGRGGAVCRGLRGDGHHPQGGLVLHAGLRADGSARPRGLLHEPCRRPDGRAARRPAVRP